MEDVMEEWKPLWCEQCQRGVVGEPNYKELKDGDVCPICREKFGKDREHDWGLLVDMEKYAEEKKKLNELLKIERERRRVKKVDGPEDVKRELKREYDMRLKEQQKEIETLKAMFKNQQKSGSGKTV